MIERVAVFLFLVLVVLGSLGGVGWLLATGQTASIEGIFLVLTALVLALVCGVAIYVMIRGAMDATQLAAAPAKPAGTATPKTAGRP